MTIPGRTLSQIGAAPGKGWVGSQTPQPWVSSCTLQKALKLLSRILGLHTKLLKTTGSVLETVYEETEAQKQSDN